MNETPANTAREDSPASGASPDGQVPGKIVCVDSGMGLRPIFEPLPEFHPTELRWSEPIPADDEQVEGAA